MKLKAKIRLWNERSVCRKERSRGIGGRDWGLRIVTGCEFRHRDRD